MCSMYSGSQTDRVCLYVVFFSLKWLCPAQFFALVASNDTYGMNKSIDTLIHSYTEIYCIVTQNLEYFYYIKFVSRGRSLWQNLASLTEVIPPDLFHVFVLFVLNSLRPKSPVMTPTGQKGWWLLIFLIHLTHLS